MLQKHVKTSTNLSGNRNVQFFSETKNDKFVMPFIIFNITVPCCNHDRIYISLCQVLCYYKYLFPLNIERNVCAQNFLDQHLSLLKIKSVYTVWLMKEKYFQFNQINIIYLAFLINLWYAKTIIYFSVL